VPINLEELVAMSEKRDLKNVELKLIAELMKNSNRSSRELAKAVGVSSITIGRMKKRLEREGIIQEYTMIPDPRKLGYQILAVTLVKLNRQLNEKEIEEARKLIKEIMKTMPLEILMLERGVGMGFDGVIIGYQRDYTTHTIVRLAQKNRISGHRKNRILPCRSERRSPVHSSVSIVPCPMRLDDEGKEWKVLSHE